MNKEQHWIVRPNSGSAGQIFYNKKEGVFSKTRPAPLTDEDLYSAPSYTANAPLKAYFDMTYLCNLNCKHCITNSSPWKDLTQELPTNRILELVEELAAIGVLEIAVGGGEPMVHPDWTTIFKYITDLGMNLIITTNGLLINERNLQHLQVINPLEVCISFDGGRSFHNSIRGKDTYDKALKALKSLIKKDINATARFTYCNGANDEMEQLFEDLASTGCKNCYT